MIYAVYVLSSPVVEFSSENDKLPPLGAPLSYVLFKPHLNVVANIKHSDDIWLRWGFLLIAVCVGL